MIKTRFYKFIYTLCLNNMSFVVMTSKTCSCFRSNCLNYIINSINRGEYATINMKWLGSSSLFKSKLVSL